MLLTLLISRMGSWWSLCRGVGRRMEISDSYPDKSVGRVRTDDVAHDEQHSELIHGCQLLDSLMEVFWV